MKNSIIVKTLQNPLASHFDVGQWVAINENGFIPYSFCEIVITEKSISTAIVQLHYSKGGKKFIEYDIHIPYEHLKI